MFNQRDQADGLRRIMRKDRRVIHIMTADGMPAQHWLVNLAASFVPEQPSLLLIQNQNPAMTERIASLQTVALKQSTLLHAVHAHDLGFDLARLTENNALTQPLSANLKTALNGIVKQLAFQYNTVMIEVQHNPAQGQTVTLLPEHELIIQMSLDKADIKSAYTCLKYLQQQYGKRPFGVLVTQASPAQGNQYFMRLNQVCNQFLGINLNFLGTIPKNANQQTPAAMGLNAMEALKAVASSLGKQRLTTASLAMA